MFHLYIHNKFCQAGLFSVENKKITSVNREIKIKSPCTGKCKYNEDKICISCKRTMYEIVNWIDFTDEQKIKVLKRIGKYQK